MFSKGQNRSLHDIRNACFGELLADEQKPSAVARDGIAELPQGSQAESMGRPGVLVEHGDIGARMLCEVAHRGPQRDTCWGLDSNAVPAAMAGDGAWPARH